MSALTELMQRARAQRFAGGGDPSVPPLTPEEASALRELQSFLRHFASNALVRGASAEDRARLEEFYSAIGPVSCCVADRDQHIADHAQAFIRATTRPEIGWFGQQVRLRGGV